MNGAPARSREPSAVEWLRRLERREISAVELVRRVVDRVESANRTLNAVVAMNVEQSLDEARRADALRSSGRSLPLLGLPITDDSS